MVSLWPWKSSDDDSASFEKTLSALSTKITKANVTRDGLRARSRRYKVLWTLYTSLAYLLSALILVLVTGWRNWGPVEYTVIAGSPIAIYLVRMALSSYYNFRISSAQAHLAQLQKQRQEAIDKFKAATKYDTTQQLLEKYGAAPPKPPAASRPESSSPSSKKAKPAPQESRTGLAPPATANIRRPANPASSASNQIQGQAQPAQQVTPSAPTAYAALNHNGNSPSNSLPGPPSPTAEFAPNAYTNPPPQYSSSAGGDAFRPQWYDRIMDLLLGEDETKAANRLALICEHCRLVNGQAPPGVRAPEDVGRWRCAACKGWNGMDKASEVTRIVREAAAGASGVVGGGASAEPPEEAEDDDEEDDGELVERTSSGEVEASTEDEVPVKSEDAGESPPARSTRSRRSASKK